MHGCQRAMKLTNQIVSPDYLRARAEKLLMRGFPKSKWIFFCEEMLRLRFVVEIYEARQTFSKYCTVKLPDNSGRTFKVRFSDHKPIYRREVAGDCDFFVGKTHTGVRTTADAIKATCAFFDVEPKTLFENPWRHDRVVEDFV